MAVGSRDPGDSAMVPDKPQGDSDTPAALAETPNKVEYLISEHGLLREEIIKRIEIRYQVVGLTLLFAGTFIGVGIQQDVPGSFLLLYPLMAMFLVSAWARIGVETHNIARYIREHVESQLGSPGWETFRAKGGLDNKRTLPRVLSSRGIFLGTEVFTVILGILRDPAPLVDAVHDITALDLSALPAHLFASPDHILAPVLIVFDLLALVVTAFISDHPPAAAL